MALGTAAASALLKSQTQLQQLLEEINFQRTKEMRQLLKDDSGFVVLQGTTYWTDLFVRHFLFQSEPVHSIDSDDLLFFVRKKHVKGSSRHMPKFETEVDVYRKDSRKLPIGDPDVDWEETVYLNMVIHQFDYTLTLAICTRTSPKELQVLRRHSQRVYASPSRRKMDTKGEGEEMTYPHICFMVDNFDEVFSDILVRDGEMVCVELVASDKDGSVQGVIFLGSIRYDALKKVYDARQSSLSSKVAQRMTFGLFSSGAGPQTRCEFVRMKGPQGKGHAEMAVTKPKGSGVETPTSEPGYCATDMWDEWDEDPDDFYNYRHQRRLSDPSANLNNFTRYGWRTKTGTEAAGKARSENEGLDSLASEVSEIEAGDLRDDRPASSASETKLNATTPTCCNCFGPKCKRWSDSESAQMSEIYCRSCEEDEAKNSLLSASKTSASAELVAASIPISGAASAAAAAAVSAAEAAAAAAIEDSPACLSKVTTKRTKPKHRNLLNIESELVLPPSNNKKKNPVAKKEKPPAKKAPSKSPSPRSPLKKKLNQSTVNNSSSNSHSSSIKRKSLNGRNNNEKLEEYELADDATSLNGELTSNDDVIKIGILSEQDTKNMISVHGKEELPAEQTNNKDPNSFSTKKCTLSETKSHPLEPKIITNSSNSDNISDESNFNEEPLETEALLLQNDCNGNEGKTVESTILKSTENVSETDATTAPSKMKKTSVHQNFYNKALRMVPKTTTPDGTNIYYWCDLPKRALKELDDGAYNPLWATRGFTQTFHFWKENRRQQSTPLNAFLTYVTLPWWSIAKDLLDHRETPILTF